MKLLFLILIAGFLFVGEQPELKKIKVKPAIVKTGGLIKVRLEFTGEISDIASVHLYNVEMPELAPVMKLNAVYGKKNIWEYENTVLDAPSGIYHWEVKAVDRHGIEIVRKMFAENKYGKTGMLQFEIK